MKTITIIAPIQKVKHFLQFVSQHTDNAYTAQVGDIFRLRKATPKWYIMYKHKDSNSVGTYVRFSKLQEELLPEELSVYFRLSGTKPSVIDIKVLS